jgi:hypothetical protein
MIELPKWIDKEIWNGWEESRKKMRKPLTDYARKLAVKKLLEIYRATGDHPADVLEQSILCGYQGLFPVHQGRSGQRDDELRKELRAGQGPVTH